MFDDIGIGQIQCQRTTEFNTGLFWQCFSSQSSDALAQRFEFCCRLDVI